MESIYGNKKPELEEVMQMLLREIGVIRRDMAKDLGMDPIEHLLGRIKSEDSMREKCRRKGLPETTESALVQIMPRSSCAPSPWTPGRLWNTISNTKRIYAGI